MYTWICGCRSRFRTALSSKDSVIVVSPVIFRQPNLWICIQVQSGLPDDESYLKIGFGGIGWIHFDDTSQVTPAYSNRTIFCIFLQTRFRQGQRNFIRRCLCSGSDVAEVVSRCSLLAFIIYFNSQILAEAEINFCLEMRESQSSVNFFFQFWV